MANSQLPHQKYQKYYNNAQVFNIGTTTTTQRAMWKIAEKKAYHQQMIMNNTIFTDNNSYRCQMQFNNKKSGTFVPSRSSQITSKRDITSCPTPSQKKKPLKSSLSTPFQNSQGLRHLTSPSQQKTFMSSPMPTQIPYAPKCEVPACLPPTSQPQQQYNDVMTQEQTQFRRMSFESSGCFCCKESEGSKISQFFVVKLPGMERLIFVPKCTVEKKDQQAYASAPTKMHVDQSVTVKLPGMIRNSVLLCEEPWWLSPKETSLLSSVPSSVPSQVVVEEEEGDDDDDVEEEYESVCQIKIQLGVTPIVKLPSTSPAVKLGPRKEIEWTNDYFYVTTSDCIEFDNEPPVVQLRPKPIPSPRCNLPNLKIETNIKLDKDDDDGFLPSAGCSTLSSPTSDLFSNISTYAESENTVFTEEDILNETKYCNAPERRSPSVLSDFSSEHLSPVLEEEEEESKGTTPLPIEDCQEETAAEESLEPERVDVDISPNVIDSDEEYQESQESQEYQESQESQESQEYMLPELREIAEQLKKLRSDSSEAIRIRRQIETIDRDNYPDSLPLSNKWTMYFADTSVTKTNTRVISKNKYSSTLNPIFECATVPELCSNLREFSSKIKPSDLKTNVNLSFFKGNIMPMWEDEANNKGGRFTFCPPRSQLNCLWNSIVLLLAGETIDDSNVICGAICARRDRGDRVELWISGDANSKAIDRIRDLLTIELGHETVRNVKYKKHLGKP